MTKMHHGDVQSTIGERGDLINVALLILTVFTDKKELHRVSKALSGIDNTMAIGHVINLSFRKWKFYSYYSLLIMPIFFNRNYQIVRVFGTVPTSRIPII